MARGQFVQAGYTVPNLAEAIEQWRATAEIGPFYIMRDIRPENGLYRGRPSELVMQIAFAQAGPVQIELIEELSDVPSVYRDMFPDGAYGFHHLCYFAKDIQEEIAHFRAQGAETAYIANVGDLKFGYFDTRAQLGCFTEILEEEPGVLELFKMIADGARDWDGSDPIRELA